MAKETKIIHFTIIDGTSDEVVELQKHLVKLKDKLSYDLEFLITNDKVESMSVDKLLKSLMKLYKKK